MPQVFFQTLARHARDRGAAEAVRFIGRDGSTRHSIDYLTLHQSIEEFAANARLRHEVPEPTLVALPNGIEYIITFLGVLRGGRSVFPLHRGLTRPEREQAADDSAAVEGTFLILRSSGTTGSPKLVRRDGPSLDAVARNVAQATGLTERDRVLVTIPLCHSYGIENGLLAPLLAGATIHLCEGFDPHLVLRQWREGVTVMPGVPFMFEVLAGLGERGAAKILRLAYSAGAMLPRSVFDAFADRHGLALGQLYGATEIGSVTFNDPGAGRLGFDPLSVGLPMNGVSIRVLDAEEPSLTRTLPAGIEGHVAVRAPSMLTGYIGDPGGGEPLLGGYFLTGDLGRIDECGALTITGRLKLLIDIGGMKVNPLEVEAVLAQHPAIGECAIVPVPVSATLVRLKAYIAPRDRQTIDMEELRRFARERLAGYKVPRVFEVVDRLPKSPLGKVQRQVLMELSR